MLRTLSLIVLVVAITDAPAGDKIPWRNLLDKSLDAWQNSAGKAPAKGWALEDDALVLSKGGGYIWTKERFGDFILDLEVLTDGNSGIFIRTDKLSDPVQTGIEVQVDNPSDKPGKHSFGSFYDLVAPKKNPAKKGEWTRVVVSANGNLLKVEMNGELINEMDLDKWTEPGLNPDGTKNKYKTALKDFKREGHIGFQDHGATVKYRNIKIKALTPDKGKVKTRILLIGHDPDHAHGTHMYMHTCGMLAKCLELTPGVEAAVSNLWPKDAAVLRDVKSIVLYTKPAAELLLEGPHRGEVDKMMQSGVGLVTIHWASSVNKANFDRLGPTWLRYLGGTWVSNVGLSGGKSTLKQLVPKHAICRGWSEHEIDDEYYLDPTIEKATPFLQVTERKGKDVIVGWVHEREGAGRAFATTLGHPYANFQQDAFRRMIVNGILWSAHLDVPTEGAPVNISKEVLALPPKK